MNFSVQLLDGMRRSDACLGKVPYNVIARLFVCREHVEHDWQRNIRLKQRCDSKINIQLSRSKKIVLISINSLPNSESV